MTIIDYDKNRKIALVAVGGTLACGTGTGKTPKNGASYIKSVIPELSDYCIDGYDFDRIDSVDMTPKRCSELAEFVYKILPKYDGVVITHGTDTMSETSNLLSFLLQDLNKPIVITGSMKPLEEKNSDAVRNVKDAFMTAASNLAGVYLAFNGRIINGTRAKKLDPTIDDAFRSVKFGQTAETLNDKLYLLNENVSFRNGQSPKLYKNIEENVAVEEIHQGYDPRKMELLKYLPDCRAVVLKCPGTGGIPKNLLEPVKSLVEKGKIIAVTSKCDSPYVDLSAYEVGQRLLGLGDSVIDCKDMTADTAMAKLRWTLGSMDKIEPAKVKEMMQTPVHYEISMPKPIERVYENHKIPEPVVQAA